VICVRAVDKGLRRRFGVRAVDKGVRDGTGKSKSQGLETKSEGRNSRGESEGELVKKGKGLAAERWARGDFTGYDRAGWLGCTVPI